MGRRKARAHSPVGQTVNGGFISPGAANHATPDPMPEQFEIVRVEYTPKQAL